MADISIQDDIVIELEFEQEDVVIDLALDKVEIDLTPEQQTMFRGEPGEIFSASYETTDWEQLSANSYRLIVSRETHQFNAPYIAEMFIVDEDGAENNLRPTYRVSANDSIVIFSDKPIDCNIKIGGQK